MNNSSVLSQVFICLLLISACSTLKKINKKDLYGVWSVRSLQTADKKVAGDEMGNPTYEFTKSGKRIQRFANETKEVTYKLNGSTISYPDSKLPDVEVIKLTSKELILKNDKVEWILFKP